MMTKANLLSVLLINFILISLPDHIVANENNVTSKITISSFVNNNDSIQEHTTVIDLNNNNQVAFLLDSIFDATGIDLEEFKNHIESSTEFFKDSMLPYLDHHLSFNNFKEKVALGVIIEEYNQNNHQKYKNPHISKVIPGSPAEQAGLQKNDILYKIDYSEMNSLNEIVDMIKNKSEGDSLHLSYIRDNDTLTTVAVLKSVQHQKSWASLLQQGVGSSDSCKIKADPFCKKIMIQKGNPKLGVKVQDLDDEARKALKVKNGGALITKVIEHTTAEEMKLRTNDVITAVNGQVIQNVKELKSIIDSYPAQETVHLKYMRYGKKKKASGVLRDFSLEWDDSDMMKIIDLSGLFEE